MKVTLIRGTIYKIREMEFQQPVIVMFHLFRAFSRAFQKCDMRLHYPIQILYIREHWNCALARLRHPSTLHCGYGSIQSIRIHSNTHASASTAGGLHFAHTRPNREKHTMWSSFFLLLLLVDRHSAEVLLLRSLWPHCWFCSLCSV